MGSEVNATPRPLYPWERDPVSIVQEAGWASMPVWRGAGNLAFAGVRIPILPARSDSLYRLRYLGPHIQFYMYTLYIYVCVCVCVCMYTHTQ